MENFPNLVKKTDVQVQEAQKIPNKINPKRPTPSQIIIKIAKFKGKERILKVAKEAPITLSAISQQKLQA